MYMQWHDDPKQTHKRINDDRPELYSLNQTNKTLKDPAYWRQLCPKLSIGKADRSVVPFDFSEAEITQFKAQLKHDGFLILTTERLPWAISVADIADSIRTLKAHGWHPTFVSLFDEPWLLASQLSKLFAALGNTLTCDWLAHYVEPPVHHETAGTVPHRDFERCPPESWFPDGAAKIHTVWVALTDATPENSCPYIVPASKDRFYGIDQPDESRQKSACAAVFSDDSMFQNIMAVPLKAGGLVTFTHHSLHWGSASTRYAKHPRAALEFVMSEPEYKRPFLAPQHLPLPPFAVRLGLTCGQVLVYNKRYTNSAGWPFTSRPDWDYDMLVMILQLFQERLLDLDETFAKTVFASPILPAIQKYLQGKAKSMIVSVGLDDL